MNEALAKVEGIEPSLAGLESAARPLYYTPVNKKPLDFVKRLRINLSKAILLDYWVK